MSRLTLLTRADCGLCEDMHAALDSLAATLELPPLEIADVDADPVTRRRFGLKIPVLLLDGTLVCYGRLDEGELRRMLRTSPR